VSDGEPKSPPEPTVRVVDRRWWARKEGDEAEESGGVRKPSYVENLERQIAEHAVQIQTFAAERRRSLDEFEQVKTRMRRDLAREVEREKRTVLVELLDVMDNLDRAVAAARAGTGSNDAGASDSSGALLRGVELVRDQFSAKLAGFGVTRVPSVGQPFDATRHEAVTTTPVADAQQDGLVIAAVREGYAIGDEVLRPASVVVGRAEPQE
jgi:molecular chaperone GrpE